MAKTAREQIGVDLPEAQDPPAAQEEVQEDRPGWLPEQFESPEAFAKSYNDLRVELKERGDNARLMEQKMESLETLIETIGSQQQQPQQQQQPSNYNEQLMAAYENDPIGTMVFLAQNVAQNTVDQVMRQQQPQNATQAQLQGEMVGAMAQRSLEQKYEDWTDYRDKVAEAINQDPSLMPDSAFESVGTASKRMEAVYKQVKFDDLNERLSRGESSAQNLTHMKQQAQTVSGGVGRPGEPSEADQKIERLIAAAKNSSYSSWRG